MAKVNVFIGFCFASFIIPPRGYVFLFFCFFFVTVTFLLSVSFILSVNITAQKVKTEL